LKQLLPHQVVRGVEFTFSIEDVMIHIINYQFTVDSDSFLVYNYTVLYFYL